MTSHSFSLVGFILVSSLLLTACSGPGSPLTQNQNSTSSASPSPSITQSSSRSNIRDLMAKNQTVKCNLKTTTEGVDSNATVYIQNGKSKIITNIQIDNETPIESNMVMDGDTLYTWQTGSPQGMKIDVKNYANSGNNSQDSTNGKVDIDTEYDYQCQPWNGQGQSFTPPTNVSFTEMGETIKKMQQGLQGMCDSLTGDAKQSCLDALENTSR